MRRLRLRRSTANVSLFFDNLALVGTAEGDAQQGYIDEMIAVLEGSDPATGEIFKMPGNGLAAGLTVDMRDVVVADEAERQLHLRSAHQRQPDLRSPTPPAPLHVRGRRLEAQPQQTWGALAALADTGDGGDEFDAEAAAEEVDRQRVAVLRQSGAGGHRRGRRAAGLHRRDDRGARGLPIPPPARSSRCLGRLAAGLTVDMRDVVVADEAERQLHLRSAHQRQPDLRSPTPPAPLHVRGRRLEAQPQQTWGALAALADTGDS